MGFMQLAPAMVLPLHSVGTISLVWFLHRMYLLPATPLPPPRPVATRRLDELGIKPVGPASRAHINLTVDERRQDIRQAGNEVPVFIHDEFGFCQGRVMNQSRGGLSIASECNVSVGQSIRIQSQLAASDAAAIDMKVCHVRKEGDEWIFGCKFLRQQDPAILQLFS